MKTCRSPETPGQLRCPKCGNASPRSLNIASPVYQVWTPTPPIRDRKVVLSVRRYQLNMSGRGAPYVLMCRRLVCGAISPVPAWLTIEPGP